MENQKGYSWPETILTLVVLIVVFGTLLPLASKITSGLYEKKMAMYAAETAYHGTITFHAHAINKGTRHIDGIDYEWEIAEGAICITYRPGGKVMSKCVNFLEG